jgi:hypothetical protein
VNKLGHFNFYKNPAFRLREQSSDTLFTVSFRSDQKVVMSSSFGVAAATVLLLCAVLGTGISVGFWYARVAAEYRFQNLPVSQWNVKKCTVAFAGTETAQLYTVDLIADVWWLVPPDNRTGTATDVPASFDADYSTACAHLNISQAWVSVWRNDPLQINSLQYYYDPNPGGFVGTLCLILFTLFACCSGCAILASIVAFISEVRRRGQGFEDV